MGRRFHDGPVRVGRHRARSNAGNFRARIGVVAAICAVVLAFATNPSEATNTSAAAVTTPTTTPCTPPVTAPAPPAPPTAVLGGTFAGVKLDSLQVTTASTIVTVGSKMHVTRRGIRIALAVAMQESSLNPAATRGPYIGLFQQRVDASSGLYTQYNRLDAVGATTMFLQQLVKRVPGYQSDGRLDWEIGEVIQETNVGRNVEQWFGLSEALTAKLYLDPLITLVAPASKTLQPTPSAAPKAATRYATRVMRPAMVPALRHSGGAFAVDAGAEPTVPGIPGVAGILGGVDSVAQSVVSSVADDPSPSTTTAAPSPPTTPSNASTATSTPGTSTTTTAATTPATPSTSAALPTTPSSTTAVSRTTPTTAPTTGRTTTSASTAPRPSVTPVRPTGSPKPTTAAPTNSTAPTKSTPPVKTTAPVKITAPAKPKPVVPVNIAVNPDPPDAPVPTGTTDPSVKSDPSTSAVGSGRTPTAAGTPAVIDCSPSAGGRSTAFDPGMIISDAVFYNTKAMTAADIRTFVNSKGASCTVAACLKSLQVKTPNQAADRYCAAYRGSAKEDVASILQKLSVACGINPQVMLVTLQKESALLTRTDVTMSTYDAAYGWHCPDSGPGGSANCDPQYAGFFNQAYGMAKQWARYRIDPAKYNFHAGQTATILWNVAPSGCGGSKVLIRNTATASLYNYTPYQPNAASLAAYPGVGDKCSTYGNRNFFFLFQKYFGTTGGGVDQDVNVNGVNVTIPAGPHVAAGAAGAVIKAPTLAMAKGLAAGFAAIGLPYVYGGGTNGGGADQGCARAGGAENSCQGIVGFDCSGLTGYVLLQSGVHIPDYSGAQRAAGRSVPWSQGRAGDIIGYQGHVAVYLGVINGVPYLLESPDVGMYVQIRPVYYSNGGVPVDAVLHRYWG